jgi:hypothetical protein
MISSIAANGRDVSIIGKNKDATLVMTAQERRFEVVAQLR